MTYSSEFHELMLKVEDRASVFPGGVVDMHLHMVDFTQKTQGLKRLLEKMEEANVNKTVIFGLPVKKKWAEHAPVEPGYYLDDNAKCYYWSATDEMVARQYLSLQDDEKEKFAPTIAGLNTTDCCVGEYLDMIFEKYDIWRGVGEVLLRHDDLTNLTAGETPRGDNLALLKVIDFCYRNDLPVNIHQNVTSVGKGDAYAYMHELDWFMENSRGVRVLWAHCGVSRRLDPANYANVVEEKLMEYDNLKMDLSWVVFDNVVCDPETKAVGQEWIDLIDRHPTRFMIGSDLVGRFDTLGQTIGRYNKLLMQLKLDTAAKVARDNAEDWWF